MAERSFKKQIEKLKLGDGERFHGEGILAVAKALLQSGVAYVGGYQGSPISHLIDVFSDAQEIFADLGVRFETSASEASAAAMLAASVNYPLRGAVAWKSTVGTNVASDALANVASAGVVGGALVILGEDYGEGSSIVQERSHAFAMKSQMWLLDPRPNLPSITNMVEQAFELSEASQTPVMLQLRIRACHVHGAFDAKDNRKPAFTVEDALDKPVQIPGRMVGPPHHIEHEKEKIEKRWPAAVDYIARHRLNEHIEGSETDIGIVVLGGIYNNLNRALELLDCSDAFGDSKVPIYVLNVAYPLIDQELVEFCGSKKAILLLEEGQPDFIEQNINTILRRNDLQTHVSGKDLLPMTGDYSVRVIEEGLRGFLKSWAPQLVESEDTSVASVPESAMPDLAPNVPARPPGLCIGCPERPFFTAMKILQRETGPLQVSMDIGCHSFGGLAPFNIGNTQTGYGLGPASASAFMIPHKRRALSVMGDGGFWHNGLTSGVVNAVENQHDGVIIIVDNGYAAATGGQWIPSSDAEASGRQYGLSISNAAKGAGVKWVRKVSTFDIKQSLNVLREAMATPEKGPKVIVAEGECQLNRQRRILPLIRKRLEQGKRHVRQRFGIDADTCTGDHSCIRLSGCPSLTIADNPDPLREDPIAQVDNTCVGCGVCGEVAHAAVLCPSFYRADIVQNPNLWDRVIYRVRMRIISWLQS